jgi:hypothetical protein
MDGATAPGELTRQRWAPPRRVHFGLATRDDDAELRRLLRETPMAGAIRLSFERESDAFAADATEGDFHQTLIARDPGGRIVAMGGRSIRDAWINGQPTRLGYLGQLRISPQYRGRDTVVGGYNFLRDLHADGRTPFYLTSVMADNLPARRLLEAGVRGLPKYRPIGDWFTLAIPTRRRHPAGIDAVGAGRADADAIADCLARNNQRFEFAPVWNARDLQGSARTPAWCIQDVSVIRRPGRIAGCAAAWDQRSFKQVVVRGYGGPLGRWRRAINLLAPFTGWPRLPEVGRELRQAYLSAVAVDDDDPALFATLLARTLHVAATRGCDYLIAGFAADHPLLDVARRFRHRAVRSTLYCVHWPDGQRAVDALDSRIIHVEVATL